MEDATILENENQLEDNFIVNEITRLMKHHKEGEEVNNSPIDRDVEPTHISPSLKAITPNNTYDGKTRTNKEGDLDEELS